MEYAIKNLIIIIGFLFISIGGLGVNYGILGAKKHMVYNLLFHVPLRCCFENKFQVVDD